MDEKKDAVIIPDKVDLSRMSSGKMSLRDESIRKHYNNRETLSEMMNNEGVNTEFLIRSLLGEFAREIDNLAGNQVIATENGELESSTIISTKRTEIIDRFIKAVMTKKEFEATTSIDVESPSMMVVFKYFLEKCQESFDKAGMAAEISDAFFRNMNDVCGNSWKKDLKRRIAEIKS